MMLLTFEFVAKKVTNFICDLFNFIDLQDLLKTEVIVLDKNLIIG